MKTIMMKLMMIMSIMSLMMKSPMSMSTTLLIQTLWSIMLMNTINNYSWIPMITFLTMIGGLLIIFMYMSSITSNEKFKLNTKLLMVLTLMMMPMEELMSNYQNQEEQNLETKLNTMMSLTKMYNKSMMMTMLMILYLMLTMITVNKIIKMFEGPLRSNTYE
uniref:NADH dehydrogenase subunit 6 n=1 Tax=Leptobelus gazella TaxID=1030472 RepID=V9I131_LEPGZ|nr:NADH dehydrogenase subunit 6 [Leptobelus gazella]AEE89608.1 NADH dehydrogenase subunit 6 [Leptobelus gazella]